MIMIIEAISDIIREHWNNRDLIKKVARDNTKRETSRTSLGIFWLYFRDMVYFAVYIVFRILMAGNSNVDGMDNVAFVLLGLISWFFMSDVLNKGATAIKANRGIIKSIKFPISTLSSISVCSIFYQRLFVFGVGFLVPVLFGYSDKINIFWALYFIFCNVILMISINFIFSALVAISGDFHQLYMAVTRILIYLLPVIWTFTKISNPYIVIFLKLNPMSYVISGYRNALALGMGPSLNETVYFWVMVIVIFSFGSLIQFKLKKYFSDFV